MKANYEVEENFEVDEKPPKKAPKKGGKRC